MAFICQSILFLNEKKNEYANNTIQSFFRKISKQLSRNWLYFIVWVFNELFLDENFDFHCLILPINSEDILIKISCMYLPDILIEPCTLWALLIESTLYAINRTHAHCYRMIAVAFECISLSVIRNGKFMRIPPSSFCLRKSWPDKWTQLAASSWSCDLTMTGNFQCHFCSRPSDKMCLHFIDSGAIAGRNPSVQCQNRKLNKRFLVCM